MQGPWPRKPAPMEAPRPEDEAGLPDLLERFRGGDRDAFQRIVGAFQARLVQFFYRLCWDRDRAEDLTQDLFLKLLRSQGSYRSEGKLSTYLFRMATNLWIDEYRARRPQRGLYSLDQVLLEGAAAEVRPGVAPEPCGPVENAIDDEERARLRQAVETLTEPHRLVLELAVYQELPYQEISEILAIPIGTIKSRMHNAVHALRDKLGAGEAQQAPRRAAGGGS